MEYQYYEFAAIDKPLDSTARDHLRSISSRANITATSFVNHYEYGSLKANPMALMEQYFDLFVYVTNFGTRSFLMRIPKSVWDDLNVENFAIDEEVMTVHNAGNNVILSVGHNEDEGFEEWDDGSAWMAKLAPLRGLLIAGDMSLFYALWLMQIDKGWVRDETMEPMPGIAEPSESLMALAKFLNFDRDLILASVRKQVVPLSSEDEIRAFIRRLSEDEKVDLLAQVCIGNDPNLGVKLQRRYKKSIQSATTTLRSAIELKNIAQTIRSSNERIAKVKAEKLQIEKIKDEARKKHLATLETRGEAVWLEVDNLVALRNAQGYDKAATILFDLAEIAAQNGTTSTFKKCLTTVCDKHSNKRKFIERINKLQVQT